MLEKAKIHFQIAGYDIGVITNHHPIIIANWVTTVLDSHGASCPMHSLQIKETRSLLLR